MDGSIREFNHGTNPIRQKNKLRDRSKRRPTLTAKYELNK